MSAVFEAEGLVAGYGTVRVVHGIDISVAPGEVVALLGPNGAGKTTTLLTISGLLRPLGGSLRIFGEAAGKRSASRIARSGLAHVPEDRSLFTQLTVAENIRLACRGPGRRAREEEVLGYFPELARIRSRKAGLLSGGEQQMLAVGRALASSPRLLLVDEMSLGLAPVVVRRLLPILRTIAREGGIGVLFSEQHVQLALDLADRTYLVNRGGSRCPAPVRSCARARTSSRRATWSNERLGDG
jgi:branched-chain amino acid transport system ATP-binding protein